MTANLWQLFLSFMQVGMFSIGGGYAAMPFIRSQVVSLHGWLTMSEFTDLVTIAEMTPGPIAINAATFVGNRLAGFTGAIVATMGCILPSCLIVSLLAYLYRKYRQMDMLQNVLTCLRPAVVALIASAGLEILRQAKAVRAAFFDGHAPYVVPMGFEWFVNGMQPVVCLMMPKEGRKAEALSVCTQVCLEFEAPDAAAIQVVLAEGKAVPLSLIHI